MKLNKSERRKLETTLHEYYEAYAETMAEERRLNAEYQKKLKEIHSKQDEIVKQYKPIERILNIEY